MKIKFQELLDSSLISGFDQKMKINSFQKFESRGDIMNTIPTRFNKVRGVYIFEHLNHGVIYIGSSGKIPINPKSQGIRNRIIHGYTPYKLDEKNLEYFVKELFENKKQHFKLSDVTIHTIELYNKSYPISVPSVLEHLLIQSFYNLTGQLPVINRTI